MAKRFLLILIMILLALPAAVAQNAVRVTGGDTLSPATSLNPFPVIIANGPGMQPVTVDDETGSLPDSRQLADGTGTAIDTATAGKIKVNSTIASGTALLALGTSGAIVNASVTANSIIMCTYKGVTVNPGILSVTPGAGSFTIDSSDATDGSTVMYSVIKF